MQFFWPLEKIFVTQKFGNKSKAYALGYHFGIDLRAKIGTPVYAARDGRVVISKSVPPYDGYGAHIVIDHGEGFYSLYGHLDQVLIGLGKAVKTGQLIGHSGGSPQYYGAVAGASKIKGKFTKAGFSTAPHLHFEIDKGGIGPRFGIDPQKITSFNPQKPMEEQNLDPNFIPDWAKPAVEKMRKKGFKIENPNTEIKKYELCEMFNKLGLLDSFPDASTQK